jgi:ATP-dependent 26S proteasome regulatory subunit
MKKTTIRPPLVLGIHGPSGEGKTYQCEHVLQKMSVKSCLISGGQLESHAAGEPAQLIRDTYIDASSFVKKHNQPAVLLINDVDTGLGNWGDLVQYTINRQTVFGELMHLVDYPTSVEGVETKRIPIIVTGNDFTKLYEPFVRAGRMVAFEWKPSFEEKARIVNHIFTNLSAGQSEELIETLESALTFQNEREKCLPVSFFAHLRSQLVNQELWIKIKQVGLQRTMTLISEGTEPELDINFDLQALIIAGKETIRSGQLFNHLGRL